MKISMTKIMSMNLSIAKITGHSSILDQVISSPKNATCTDVHALTYARHTSERKSQYLLNCESGRTINLCLECSCSLLLLCASMTIPLTCPKISVRCLLAELSRRDGLSSIEPDLLSNASLLPPLIRFLPLPCGLPCSELVPPAGTTEELGLVSRK